MRQPAWGPDRDLWVLSRVQGRVLAVTLHDGAQSDALESRCLSHRQAHSLTEQPKWGAFYAFRPQLNYSKRQAKKGERRGDLPIETNTY